MTAVSLIEDGFIILPAVLEKQECELIRQQLPVQLSQSGGTRNLLSKDWCIPLVSRLRSIPEIAAALPPDGKTVQCSLFDKSTDRNWSVAFHQDLTIPVRAKVSHFGCSGWS